METFPPGDFLFLCRTNAGASVFVVGYVQLSCEAKGRQEQKGGSRSLEEMSQATYTTLPFFSQSIRAGNQCCTGYSDS